MKIKNLLAHMYTRTWAGKITMTDRSLRLVMLVAAIAGATATVLTGGIIKRIILKISTPKSSKVNNNPPGFHGTACSAGFSENCMDS